MQSDAKLGEDGHGLEKLSIVNHHLNPRYHTVLLLFAIALQLERPGQQRGSSPRAHAFTEERWRRH